VYGYGASGGPGHASKHGDQAVLDDILEFYHYSAENGDVTAQVGVFNIRNYLVNCCI
jgi:hypothetical protein